MSNTFFWIKNYIKFAKKWLINYKYLSIHSFARYADDNAIMQVTI